MIRTYIAAGHADAGAWAAGSSHPLRSAPISTAVTYPDFEAAPARAPTVLKLKVAKLQHAVLWLALAASSFVFIEPSPYEFAMALAMLVFAAAGLRLRAPLIPLVLILSLLNIGYSISAAELLNQQPIVNWIATSWFLAATCIFFACAMLDDTHARLDAIKRGYFVAAIIASVAAIVGYARIISSLNDLLLLYERSRGTFKDPNVLGAFLVFPALIALQSVMTGRAKQALGGSFCYALFSAAIFLSFSRGAWGLLVFASAVTLFLMAITTTSSAQRARIVFTTILVVVVSSLALVALLSIDAVYELFVQRASLHQSYDVGAQGRFARHVLGAILALDVPFGIGPLQFSKYFPEDTHNSYLNAFMSGGWLAGVCYPALVAITVVHGFRHIFVRTPWQQTYLAVYACFLGTALESFIIDTDHWRHYFLLIGLVWGLIVASRRMIAR